MTVLSSTDRASDYYHFIELLTPEEQAVRKRVREFMEKEVAPIMTEYWEKAEFPFHIIPKLGALGVVGGSIKDVHRSIIIFSRRGFSFVSIDGTGCVSNDCFFFVSTSNGQRG
ncbi:hypothetical protein F2Q70_00004979 [Brassica cretica]|uniref:Acyl-CoA dehydrogenase/oxidase N-terminal domain-containing protein n=1 Tax=Brassica cretica TaxID=69181 RepID=A0A8S9J2X8_BRACR|nr:hypothetical protein F2Q70_00004979 [Brassica cretica]